MDEAETLEIQAGKKVAEEAIVTQDAKAEEAVEPASINGRLMRIAGPPVPVSGEKVKMAKPLNLKAKSKRPEVEELPYDEDTDAGNPRLLDVEGIVERDGLSVYKDQAGRLWTGLATYWIKRGEFDRVSERDSIQNVDSTQ